MRTMKLGTSGMEVPVLAVGLMHLNKIEGKEAEEYIQTCLDIGCNFFETADIYGDGIFGYNEEVFAKAAHMSPSVREKMFIQTKCGFTPILPGEGKPEMINTSKEYILKSVDESLRRLKTDYIDVYLLHAPDALMDPEEVADAFDRIHNSGKVRAFGVANYNTTRMQLLQKYIHQPIVTNQLMMSVVNSNLLSQNMYVNMDVEGAVDRNGGVFDYCWMNDVTIQCWSPMQYGYMGGCFLGSPKYPELNQKMNEIAAKYEVPASAIAMAWLLRIPAKLQPVTGTKNIRHLLDNAKGADITLTHEEWYQIWKAAGNFVR